MNFYVIGIDHRSADIGLREEIFAKRKEISSAFRRIFKESALLLTCNRLEVYGAGIYIGKGINANFLPQGQRWYSYSAGPAFGHALRLGAGLLSELKGETQILEQIDYWRGSLGRELAFFWQEAYSAAVEIRAFSGLTAQEYSIAGILFKDIAKHLPVFGPLKIIVAGTGKIASCLINQRPQDTEFIFAAHKNFSRARQLAEYAGGRAILLREIEEEAVCADVLISASSSPHRLFTKESIARIALRRDKPLLIYDLALPRNIAPEAGLLNGVILKDLSHLAESFSGYYAAREQDFRLAEYLIAERVNDYAKVVKNRHALKPVGLKTD